MAERMVEDEKGDTRTLLDISSVQGLLAFTFVSIPMMPKMMSMSPLFLQILGSFLACTKSFL